MQMLLKPSHRVRTALVAGKQIRSDCPENSCIKRRIHTFLSNLTKVPLGNRLLAAASIDRVDRVDRVKMWEGVERRCGS